MEQYRFKIDIPEKDLIDLERRLKHVKWPDDPGNKNWGYGVQADYLKELVNYWVDEFDWRMMEQRINRYPQYRVS